ncbi:MAG: hypothetical protein ACRC2V_04000 [Xenococcaceae cyanobacterium]
MPIKIVIFGTSIALITIGLSKPAYSQLLPRVWGSVGAKNDDVSYAGGVRFLNIGVEVGTGEDGATGGDLLGFISLPFVSPYAGIGIYSGDDSVAYSGGVHINPPGNFFFGAGYHSIRGINGQIGIKF